jgi:hypothetical protein
MSAQFSYKLFVFLVPGGGVEPPRAQGPADFESAASASSAIPARGEQSQYRTQSAFRGKCSYLKGTADVSLLTPIKSGHGYAGQSLSARPARVTSPARSRHSYETLCDDNHLLYVGSISKA